jgi:hypothetical protein
MGLLKRNSESAGPLGDRRRRGSPPPPPRAIWPRHNKRRPMGLGVREALENCGGEVRGP